MLLRVRVGGVVLNGLAANGFVIAPDGFAGWDESTATKRDTAAMPQAHGSFAVRGFRDVRVLTVSGTCLADSEQQLRFFGNQLTGTGGDGNTVRVTVDHSGETTWADGYVDGETKFTMFAAGQAATFSIQFWFANPRKFGNTLTFAGGVGAYHYGNFPATPVHTVSGSASSGYTVNGPAGKAFVVTQPLVAGVPHTINMATGFLTVNGLIVVGGVAQGDTWAIPGGATVAQSLTVPSGSAVLSTAVTDTFI